MIWLLALGSLVAYVVGLVLLTKIMPRLIKHAVDDALFIGVAAVAILGAMLAFSAVGVTYTIFNGTLLIRLVDAVLLLIMGIITLRTSLSAWRPPRFDSYPASNRLSRLLVGGFFLALALAAGAVLILLFVPSS